MLTGASCYCHPTKEGLMIKTPKGEVSFWVLGGATVVLATWQFALLVSS